MAPPATLTRKNAGRAGRKKVAAIVTATVSASRRRMLRQWVFCFVRIMTSPCAERARLLYDAGRSTSTLIQVSLNARGLSERQRVRWNVRRHEAAGADGRVLADGDAGHHDRSGADPGPVADH